MPYEKVKCWVCEQFIDNIVLNTDSTTPSQIDPIHAECEEMAYNKFQWY